MQLTNVLRISPKIIALMVLTPLIAFSVLKSTQSAGAHSIMSQQSLSSGTPTVFGKPTLVQHYQQLIKPEALAARLYFLAADLFEGRETTTPGQKLAAQYLASQYRLMGLAPKGSVNTTDALSPASYFQPFTLYKRAPKETRLEVVVGGSPVASSTFSAETHDDLSFFDSGNPQSASGGVVFAGYGIADDKLGYNDYAALAAQGISIDGKWVLMLADEPLADAQTSLFSTPEHKPSSWTTQFTNKRRALWKAGKPRGVLVVEDATPRLQGSVADAAALAALNNRRVGSLSLDQTSSLPQTYAISTKLADQLLSASGQRIADLRREINQSLKPHVFDVRGVEVRTTVEQFKPLETENVLAFIEGSDPRLKDEVVIVSAHYDHLGVNTNLKGDQIFNGAADDGSGVVACLELAQAFMRAKQEGAGPRRSILFINFSGEEKGLLGSTFYALREPLVPLEKTVADINMDGVGGIDLKHPTHSQNYIYINGAPDLSDELVEINKRVKSITATNLELTDGPGFNSDDGNFRAQLIPFIYYSTGLTEHYHTPGDEPQTIDYEHLARVVRLIFGTVWQVANQDARLKRVDRSQLTLVGYSCPPCRFECDSAVYDHPGDCPVCGMTLLPKYVSKAAAGGGVGRR